MKKNTVDKLTDYHFTFSGRKDFFINNLSFLYPKPLYIVMLGILIIFACINIETLSFLIPLFVVYWYQLFSINNGKKGIKFKRNFAPKAKEEDVINVQYIFSNPYDFDFSNLTMSDQFEGELIPKGKKGILLYFEKLSKRYRFIYQRKFKLDNGMGKKNFGPFTYFLTDTLGIHLLKATEQDTPSIKVYPKVSPVKIPATLPFEHSIPFGLYDLSTRGENINFFKTREYIEGDSINKINWKLSAKSHKTIVNEFENNSNCQINIILIDDQRVHIGTGAHSTFEYAKDIALSLCHHHITSNNSIGLFSHKKYIKPQSGRSHLVSLEMFAASSTIAQFPAADLYHKSNKVPVEVQKLEETISNLLGESSNTYIVTGIVPGKLWDYYLKLFQTAARKSKKIHITLIDGLESILNESLPEDHLWLSHMKKNFPNAIKEFEEFCRKNKITYSIVPVNRKLIASQRIKNAFKSK